jgi:hypothetical protein
MFQPRVLDGFLEPMTVVLDRGILGIDEDRYLLYSGDHDM